MHNQKPKNARYTLWPSRFSRHHTVRGEKAISRYVNLAKKHNKLGLFLGYPGCPPILNVYSLRPDQKEKNCYKLNKLVLHIVTSSYHSNL